jgi:hypothetical protein
MVCRCARPLTELLAEQPKQPFVRAIFIFDHADSSLFHVLEDTVRLINASALGMKLPRTHAPSTATAIGPLAHALDPPLSIEGPSVSGYANKDSTSGSSWPQHLQEGANSSAAHACKSHSSSANLQQPHELRMKGGDGNSGRARQGTSTEKQHSGLASVAHGRSQLLSSGRTSARGKPGVLVAGHRVCTNHASRLHRSDVSNVPAQGNDGYC